MLEPCYQKEYLSTYRDLDGGSGTTRPTDFSILHLYKHKETAPSVKTIGGYPCFRNWQDPGRLISGIKNQVFPGSQCGTADMIQTTKGEMPGAKQIPLTRYLGT